MPSRKKSWREKAASAKPAHVAKLDKAFAGVPAGANLFIPTPALVAEAVTRIPRGQQHAPQDIRKAMAAAAGADATCPVTFSIFLRIASEAALEEMSEGKKPAEIVPFWRVVKPKDPIAAKLSCGPEFIKTMRDMEGIPN